MEEQKSKTVEMKPVADSKQGKNNEGQKKLSYDELNNIAGQLARENQYLKRQLEETTGSLRTLSRLNYLLKIVEIYNSCKSGNITFTTDFIEECISEIQNVMTVPEETDADKDSKDE